MLFRFSMFRCDWYNLWSNILCVHSLQQELRQFIVLVMELCDYDLDHLVKVEPFKEETIIVFLYQLGNDKLSNCHICLNVEFFFLAQGMKALRNQNIVHRDLKPGNILIKSHPTTKKMMVRVLANNL